MTHATWSKNRFRRILSVAALAGATGAFLAAGLVPSPAHAADKPKAEKKAEKPKNAMYAVLRTCRTINEYVIAI